MRGDELLLQPHRLFKEIDACKGGLASLKDEIYISICAESGISDNFFNNAERHNAAERIGAAMHLVCVKAIFTAHVAQPRGRLEQ